MTGRKRQPTHEETEVTRDRVDSILRSVVEQTHRDLGLPPDRARELVVEYAARWCAKNGLDLLPATKRRARGKK